MIKYKELKEKSKELEYSYPSLFEDKKILIYTYDINILKLSIKNTFDKRESVSYLRDYEQILNGISSYDRIVNLWNGYVKKNKYANDIKFEEIIRELWQIY